MNKPENSTQVTSPKVTMPSGGGALRGISEPFKTQSFTGSGSFSVPFALPDARGFSPSVNLSYNSGSGNGLFGLGFSVSFDSVVRKTSNGIPRYDDTDIFIFAGAGELIPKYTNPGQGWIKSEYSYANDGISWNIVAYRPRIEGAFALIENWTDASTLMSHWKVVSADNITSLYGVSDNGRIYNPENPQQIFEWLIESSFDPHGNKIIYNYKCGDTVNIPDTIYNKGRDFTSQRYPDTIQYGTYLTTVDNVPIELFAFEVVFDYGQLDKNNPDAPPSQWLARPDPFSGYKSGFEIRTVRLCYGIFLRHYFTEENNGAAFTTAALIPEYDTTSVSGISMIKRIADRGYRLQSDNTLRIADTPATELTYQEFSPLESTWQLLEADAPGYLNSAGFIPVDLDGIGIDGLLYSGDSFTGYLAPLGNGRYQRMRLLQNFPVFNNFQSGQVSLTSLDGNNVLDLVISDGISNGFFEHTETNWRPFQPFANFPEEYLLPEKEMADLSGTGRSDLLFFESSQLKFYSSAGKAGFAEASYAFKPACFPATPHSGEEELFGFSDFFGDGLSHRFCLRNGSLTVWPCLGHGSFGEAVTFADAPLTEGFFDATRVFLIDADGNGATDIVYCYPGYARIWFNQNGNTFRDPIDIIFPATYSTITAITAGDVCGYGTASLIFTVTDPEVRHLYYDFSNKQKPYLLQTIDNGVGGLSSLTYTTSVLEQLRDKQEGRIWPTRLPIAVSVVSESKVTDEVTGAVYTQRCRYHDGYFDTTEREFRGFGFVETWDCETYEQFQVSAVLNPKAAALLDKNLWMPPVYTRSWFITGAYEQTPAISAQYSSEFYSGDSQQWNIPIYELDAGWHNQDALAIKQAYAALAGHSIRSEAYADDHSDLAQNPYTISMATSLVRLVQPLLGNRYCSVMPLEVNALNYVYDRNPEDPHISQNLALLYDEYGHPLLSATISFPRRDVTGAVIYPEQRQLRVVLSEGVYINTINLDTAKPDSFWQYIGINWQGRSYETGDLEAPTGAPFARNELLRQVQLAIQNPISPVEAPPSQPWSRLLSWSRSVYWNDDGTNALAYGEINALALLHHTETAILSPDEVSRSLGDKVNDEMLNNRCGYIQSDGYWWNFGQMQYYNWSSAQFYQPSTTPPTISGMFAESILNENGFNGASSVFYDPYCLVIVKTSAILSGTISIDNYYEYDYQAMSPVSATDANGNISELLYDPLGHVIATSVYGQVNGKDTGDLPLSQYVIQREATFDDVIANSAKYLQGATTYFYYDLFAWKARQQPVNAIRVTRSMHVQELADAGKTADDTQMPVMIAYSDGLGAVLQNKAKTTPGEVTLRRVDGAIINSSPGTGSQERWIISGYTVYNNKGMPVEQYQPYFSATPEFEDQQEIIDLQLVPPPSVIHYDPVGRVIRTDSPKGFFSKTVYSSWETKSYDFNDTMPDSPYYQWFLANYPQNPEVWQQEELAALNAALPCYNTPSILVTDNLGNPIRTIACNLGAITATTIPEPVAYPMTPQDTWNALLAAGYLAKQDPDDTDAWVTMLFQPYQSGFQQTFLQQFPDNGQRLEDYLAQSCMTSLGVYNIQSRQLYNTDPRLFLKMVREESLLFNFRNEYSMGGQVLQSESADAGLRWSLLNMAGNAVSAWDSRGFQIENAYDNLQRPIGTYISGGDSQPPLANWVQLTIYGETAPDAVDYNLVGKPWQDYDESGLSIVEAYSLGGAPLQGKTYLRPDYKTESNWTTAAQHDILDAPCYSRSCMYNAAGQVISETLPDGSQQGYVYNINGLLLASSQKIANPASNEEPQWQTVISNIVYDAAGKRTRVVNGNGVISSYTYDALTQQIVRTYTTRTVTNSQEAGAVLQDIYYTYDPVGHTISSVDNNEQVVFYNNQQVAPRNTYAYDPLYRIISAQGRTLPGLNTPEQNSVSKNSPVLPKISRIDDLQNLENYRQHFAYDFGDNLVLKRHVAASGSWTQVMTVADANNHLDTMYVGSLSSKPSGLPQFQYDANGNMLVLNPGSTATVNWNYLNHISGVVTITRELTDHETGETYTLNDAEYYQYNTSGNRVRKVTERAVYGGTRIEYTEKIYLGNYQQSRTWSLTAGVKPTDPVAPLSEKHTIVLKDGNAPALITHVWVVAPSVQTKIAAGDVQYRYQLCDPLDSVTIEVNEAAELLTLEQYYVHGGTSFTLARSQLEADSKELRFCGKERDMVTGLYYYGARYYATWLCRWMSPDPAGPVDGPNLYVYVSSNPVNYNDPTGMVQTRSQSKTASAPVLAPIVTPVVSLPSLVPAKSTKSAINLKPVKTIVKKTKKPAQTLTPAEIEEFTDEVVTRKFTKKLKDEIGGVVEGEDISHKASANLLGITLKRMLKNPDKIKGDFADKMEEITDQSAFTKKDRVIFSEGMTELRQAQKARVFSKQGAEKLSRAVRLFANRNPKNLRNRDASENRSIGAYPHYNVESGYLTDSSEEISAMLNPQLEEFSDSEYTDDEELRITKAYIQLPGNLKKVVKKTEDQTKYRKKENKYIKS